MIDKAFASKKKYVPRSPLPEAGAFSPLDTSIPNSALAASIQGEQEGGSVIPDLGAQILSRQPDMDAVPDPASLLNSSASPVSLPEDTRAELEQQFGYSMSNIKFTQSASVRQLGEQAYARGNEVRFAPGVFSPHTQEGRDVLRHEVAHIIQQSKGQVRAEGGMPINTDPGLEASADAMSSAPLSAGPLQTLTPASPAQAPAQGLLGFNWLKRKIQARRDRRAAQKEARRASREASIQKARDTFLAPEASAKGLDQLNHKQLKKTVDNMATMANDFEGARLKDLTAATPKGLGRFGESAHELDHRIVLNKPLYSKKRNFTKAVSGYFDPIIEDLYQGGNAYGFSIASQNYTGNHEFGHYINEKLIDAQIRQAKDAGWETYMNQLNSFNATKKMLEEDATLSDEDRAQMIAAAQAQVPAKPESEEPTSLDEAEDWKKGLLASRIIQDSAWQAYQSDAKFQKRMKKRAHIGADDSEADIEQKVRAAATAKNLRRMHYTSAYGGGDPSELYAEAFADYYRTKRKQEKGSRRVRENPLSKAIVEQSKRRWNAARDAGYI